MTDLADRRPPRDLKDSSSIAYSHVEMEEKGWHYRVRNRQTDPARGACAVICRTEKAISEARSRTWLKHVDTQLGKLVKPIDTDRHF